MIGIVVVGHAPWASAIVAVTRHIAPDAALPVAIDVDSDADPLGERTRIGRAIAGAAGAEGVLVCTDIFGGTPTNLCLPFLDPGRIEIVSGINLPMVLKLAHEGAARPVAEVVEFIQRYGQKHIVIASRVLEGQIGGA